MRPLDELTFQIELPLKPAEAIDRIDAACDGLAFEGLGTGLRRLWGSVGGHWFRVRAIGISHKGPAAEGFVVPDGTGSRITVIGEMDPEGTRLARQTRWGGAIGSVVALMVGFGGEPGAGIPALLIGTVFIGAAWAGYRWQRNAARRTRQVLIDVLTGEPPAPAKWRPRLPARRIGDLERDPDTQA